MIVEDNLNFRNMVNNLFKESFTNIYETPNGVEAIEMYRTNLPDLVFMDINIEELDGIKATKKIINEFPMAKIVMVSQYNSTKMVKAATDAGVMEYITKDDISGLVEIVKNYKNNIDTEI